MEHFSLGAAWAAKIEGQGLMYFGPPLRTGEDGSEVIILHAYRKKNPVELGHETRHVTVVAIDPLHAPDDLPGKIERALRDLGHHVERGQAHADDVASFSTRMEAVADDQGHVPVASTGVLATNWIADSKWVSVGYLSTDHSIYRVFEDLVGGGA